MNLDSLRNLSHILFWASVILPLLGVAAGVARYYVEREEKKIVSSLQKEELDQRKRQFEELKAETAPRKVSPDQESSLVKALTPVNGSPVVIASFVMDTESASFGKQIGKALTRAGWKVVLNDTSTNNFKGIGITCISAKQQPLAGYDVLVHALKSVDIDIEPFKLPDNTIIAKLSEGEIVIVVGRR